MNSLETLLSADRIAHRIAEMARHIRRDSPGPLHLVAVLKGAFVFAADLSRQLGGELSIDFVSLASYGEGTTSTGGVRLRHGLDQPVAGRSILVVEDIVDTGITLQYLRSLLLEGGASSVATAALLSKPSRRRVEVPVEYVGFTIEDRFVVGYGLDHAERFRQLPYVAAMDA